MSSTIVGGRLGPWEDRSSLVGTLTAPRYLRGAWVGRLYSVQLYAAERYGEASRWAFGATIDHLHVQRHDGRPIRSWPDLQAIKADLLPDGARRWAVEVYPPEGLVVDSANAYHLWVYPLGVAPAGFGPPGVPWGLHVDVNDEAPA